MLQRGGALDQQAHKDWHFRDRFTLLCLEFVDGAFWSIRLI